MNRHDRKKPVERRKYRQTHTKTGRQTNRYDRETDGWMNRNKQTDNVERSMTDRQTDNSPSEIDIDKQTNKNRTYMHANRQVENILQND